MDDTALNILLVEDNADDVRLIKEALVDARTTQPTAPLVRITAVPRLGEGLTHLREPLFDVVLLELSLPDSEGLETFTRLHAAFPNVPVVVLSHLNDDAVATNAVRQGAQDYLLKEQLDGDRLLRSLRYAIARAQAQIAREREVQKAIQESEERFRTVQEASSDGLMLFKPVRDAQGAIVDFEWLYTNPAGERTLHRSNAELVGKRMLEVIPGNRDKGHFHAYAHAFEHKTMDRREFFYTQDGFNHAFRNTAFRLGDNLALLFEDITDRKRTEQERDELLAREQKACTQAEASEQKYRFLAEAMPQIVWTAKPDGSLDYVNQVLADYIGKSVAEALGTGWYDIVHPDDRALSIERWTRSVATGERYEVEHRVRRFDGVYRWFLARSLAMRDERGQITKWFGTSTDIEEQKRIEAQVERARAQAETERVRLHALLTQAPVPVAVWHGADHIYQLANPRYAQMVGRSHLLGRSLREVFPELEGQGIFEIFDRVYETGESFRIEEYPLRLDRQNQGVLEEVFFAFNLEAIRDPAGGIQGLMAVAIDVTDRVFARRRLEAIADQLANQRAWLEAVLDRMPVPLVLVEPKTARFTFSNKVADAMWGSTLPKPSSEHEYPDLYLLTDASGKPVPTERIPAVRAANGETIIGEQLDSHTPRGKVSLLIDSSTVPAMAGHPETVVVTFQDVTKLKEAERVARQAQTIAEEANRAKDEFLATISHELRTPLHAMLGWARLLRNGLDEERQVRAIEVIERNAVAQTQLIEDLLDVSRIVSGKLRLDIQPVELVRIVETAVESVRPAIDAKDIRFQPALDPSAGPIMGDPSRLQQVVWNLLSNAVKFTPKGGRIQLTVAPVNSHIEIAVTDTGRGIRSELLPHVFERFQQGDGKITRAYGGLGLGLAIARHFVELHGGTIEAQSEGEDCGATFRVRLPRAPIRHQTANGTLVHPRALQAVEFDFPPELSGIRVLIVDDEQDARDLLMAIVETCGCKAHAVGSVQEALAMIETAPPDVLLSDIGMPEEDGYTLIQKVRALPGERGAIPAAALTAYARAEDRRKVLLAGYQMHIPKPVEPAELFAVLANLARIAMK